MMTSLPRDDIVTAWQSTFPKIPWQCLSRHETISNAIGDYTVAIRLMPDYGFAYKYRGIAYRQLSLNAQAQADFAKSFINSDLYSVIKKSESTHKYFRRQ
jgi:hypothetical protein